MVRAERGDAARVAERAASWLAVAITLLGFALRLHQLGAAPLWWDEGISVFLAAQSVPRLTWAKDLEIDLHPPLYALLLLGWGKLAGLGPFAVRWFSVWFGTLGLPLAYALFRRWLGTGAALLATLLAAVSPVLVYYSQEARMYALVPALALVSLLAWDETRRRLDRDDAIRVPAMAWIVAATLSLYAYYYTVWLIGAQLALGLIGRQFPRRLRCWTLLGAAVGALYVIWPVTLLRAEADWWGNGIGQAPPHALDAFLDVTWRTLVLGFTVEPPITDLLGGLALALALFGLALGPWRGRGPRWFVCALAAVPVACSFAMLQYRDFYFPRLVLPAAFMIAGLVAAGLAAIWQRQAALAGLALAALLWGSAFSLGQQWLDPHLAFRTDAFMTELATVRAAVAPGDAVICSQPWQCGYARSYLDPVPLPVTAATPAWLASPGRLAREIDQFSAGRERVWTITLAPTGQLDRLDLEQSLPAGLPLALVDQFGDTRVARFGSPDPVDVTRLGLTPLTADFGDTIRLLGFGVEPADALRAGEPLHLTLAWQSLRPVAADYTVFRQLLDAGDEVVAQRDAPPLAGTLPTSRWQPGAVVIDRVDIPVPPTVTRSHGALIVGLYDPGTGARLQMTDGSDFVRLADLTIAAP